MEQDPDAPPTFWFQPPLTTNRRRTPLIDPVVLIILLPIIALLFLFFVLPPVLFHTSHILKPGSVKSTWDSLNIFLVLFAILCGVMARRNDEVSSSSDVADQANDSVADNRNGVEPSGQWVGFSDQKVVTGGLRRSSSSYPDLRQESLGENGENRGRFFDDFDVNMYSSPVSRYYNNLSRRMEREREKERENLYRSTPVSGDIRQRSRRSEADRGAFSDVKEIVVDTFEVSPNASDFREQATVTRPPPPPPPPPSVVSANSRRHSFRSVGRNIKVEIPRKTESDELDKVRSYHPPLPPPPPPPLPPPPPPLTEVRLQRSHYKHKKLEQKVTDATKEIATAISSLYNQRKRKNKRKLRNISGSSYSSPPSVHFIRSPDIQEPQQTVASPPPPPPPPPPPSMFQNLFKKGGKHKRIHSVPATVPPPPPPPPPSSIFNNLFKSGDKSKRFHSSSTAPPPPPPPPSSSIMNSLFKNGTKSKRFNSFITASSPPPPPPPPPPPMAPPRYIVPVKSKQVSKRKSQAQPPSPPSPPKSEPRNHHSTSKGKPPIPTKASSYYDRDGFLPAAPSLR